VRGAWRLRATSGCPDTNGPRPPVVGCSSDTVESADASRFERQQVERIAALANLELDEADLDLFARQLGEILAYASEVQQVDTSDVPPTSHVVTRHTAERPDELRPCLDIAEVLANAPDADKDAGLFKVPRVITHGG